MLRILVSISFFMNLHKGFLLLLLLPLLLFVLYQNPMYPLTQEVHFLPIESFQFYLVFKVLDFLDSFLRKWLLIMKGMRFVQQRLELFLISLRQLLKDVGRQIQCCDLRWTQSHPLQIETIAATTTDIGRRRRRGSSSSSRTRRRSGSAIVVGFVAGAAATPPRHGSIVAIGMQHRKPVRIAIAQSVDGQSQDFLQVLYPVSCRHVRKTFPRHQYTGVIAQKELVFH